MAINYPISIDSFVNPSGGDNLNTPSVTHHVQHSNINDAVIALETKVGVDSSTDGSSLDYRLGTPSLIPPVNSDFSWANQGSTSLDLTGPGIVLIAPDQSSVDEIHLRVKPVIGSTFTLTVYQESHILAPSYSNSAIGVRDSGTGKMITFGFSPTAGPFVSKRSNFTTGDGTYYFPNYNAFNIYKHWFRIVLDSTNISFYYSQNGYDFLFLTQQLKNDYLATIDQVWFGSNNFSSGSNSYQRILSWEEV